MPEILEILILLFIVHGYFVHSKSKMARSLKSARIYLRKVLMVIAGVKKQKMYKSIFSKKMKEW
jgi:hypothetical protein